METIMETIKDILQNILQELHMDNARGDTPLLGPGGVMDSLTAMRFIDRVQRRFQVDILTEDLNLDCLESVNTLALFIHKRRVAKVGQHVVADCDHCPEALLNDPAAIGAVIHAIAGALGTSILKEDFHVFSPVGVTGFAIVSASHIVAHTWPEYGYMGIDVFSCRDIDLTVLETVIRGFGPGITPRFRLLERTATVGPRQWPDTTN